MSDPGEIILGRLHASERREARALAAEAGVDTEDLVPAMVSAYLRLRRDAVHALPADPIRSLKAWCQK